MNFRQSLRWIKDELESQFNGDAGTPYEDGAKNLHPFFTIIFTAFTLIFAFLIVAFLKEMIGSKLGWILLSWLFAIPLATILAMLLLWVVITLIQLFLKIYKWIWFDDVGTE